MISKHISYKEGVYSATATRRGIDNVPNDEQLANMELIAEKVFEPLRKYVGGPIKINSFFRCPKLNKAIGGSSTSQHCAQNKDAAIDFEFFDTSVNLEAVFHWITQLSNLPFDQCIAEFLPEGWIHISYKSNGEKNRHKITRAMKIDGKTKYKQLGNAPWA